MEALRKIKGEIFRRAGALNSEELLCIENSRRKARVENERQ